MKYYVGTGFVNSLINNLPYELHLPGYKFCGPGTRLEDRLKRGDRGVNALDESCRKHDVAYAQNKDLGARHKADDILANDALAVLKSKEASVGERLSALGVAGVMKAKVKLGMGLRNSPNVKKCLQLLQKVKKSSQNLVDDIDKSIEALQVNVSKQPKRTTSSAPKKSRAVTRKIPPKRKRSNENKMDELMDIDPPVSLPQPSSPLQPLGVVSSSRKRKHEASSTESVKVPKVDLSERIRYAARKRKLNDDVDIASDIISSEKKQKLI